MVYIPGNGWYIILGLSLTPSKEKSLKSNFAIDERSGKRLYQERKKEYWFMSSNMVKPGKYNHDIHLFYNITKYTITFNLVINFLVGRFM